MNFKSIFSDSPAKATSTSDLHLKVESLEDRMMLSTVQVFAAGTTGQEQIEVQIVGEAPVTFSNLGSGANSGQFRSRILTTNETITADDVRIQFVNDEFDAANNIDRNVRIDAIVIDGVRFETESNDVFSTGTWTPEDGVQRGFGRGDFLHTNGYFQFSDGNSTGTNITVNARGSEGTERFALQIDGTTVQTFSNVNTVFSSYSYQAAGTVTADQIRVVFLNDEFDPANGIDTNLIVDDIVVGGRQFETEAASTFSTGTWTPADGVTPGLGRGDTLHTNGYFQYLSSDSSGFIGLGDTQVTVDEDAGRAQIEVVRVEGSSGAASVFYQTLGVEAADGSDFVGQSNGRIDFADGQTSAFINVPLINDGRVEQTESFSVSLSRAVGAGLTVPRTAIVTIVDDESGQGLVGHFRLDETSIGQAVVDSSGNGNNGVHRNFTAPDGPTSDTPDLDSFNPRGVNFDGIDDVITVTANDALNLNGDSFTQSVWIRPELSDNGYHAVLGSSDTAVTSRYPGIWVFNQDQIHVGFGDGENWNAFTTDSVLTPGEWNHVATTFDGTTYTAYANGVEVYSTSFYAGRTPLTTNEVTIGSVGGFFLFEGGIDDVQIYNRALSASEIGALIGDASVPDLPLAEGQFVATEIAGRLTAPVEIEFLPDGRLLVASREGLVQIVNTDGTTDRTPLLDIQSIVNSGTRDRGLIGFAVHPDFENNPYIYAAFTYDPPETVGQTGLAGPDGNGSRVARISRFTVNAEGTFADPDSEFVLVGGNSTFENIGDPSQRIGLDDPHSCVDANGNPIEDCIAADETSHTIGELEFGPDGNLYIASGDGGSFGRVDPINIRSLDLDSLSGKILRIDPITGQAPTDNPFYDGDPDSNRSKVFVYGLRNPFRFALNDDANNPTIYIGDVGWTQWEELNVGTGGENFGWPAFEGGDGISARTGGYEDLAEIQEFYATNPEVEAPVWARAHSDGGTAIVLGDFVSSSYQSVYDGTLLFTDIGDQVLRAARFNSAGEVVSVDVVSQSLGFIVDIETGPDGLLYYVDLFNRSVGRLDFV